MELEQIGESLWSWRFPHRMAGIALGGRSTVARLTDGSLWIHSPGPLDDGLVAELGRLGPVRSLVAPSAMHHLHLKAAKEAFPDARRYGTAGVEKKGAALDEVLAERVDADWNEALEHVVVAGLTSTDEVVFFHRESKSLLLTDLCFNLRSLDGWFGRFAMRLNGALDRFGPSRLMKSTMRDRDAVASSIERVMEWPFERIVVCHGEIVRDRAKEQMRDAFAWLGC